MTPAEIAREYIRRGWAPVPIPARSKRPTIKSWQTLRIGDAEVAQHFHRQCNVGVLLGDPSSGLIDIDLDHPLAVELADLYLPPTGAEFGRASKPRSHRLYVVITPTETVKRQLKSHGMIVELRSSGCQTVFPGSVHPSGEPIEWAADGEPARVTPELLLAAVNALADEVERRLNPTPEPARTEVAAEEVAECTGNLAGEVGERQLSGDQRNPVEKFLAALTARGCEPSSSGTGWSARCPAHEDRRASLSIGNGEDGRVLLKCHAGCPTAAIVGALGLQVRDLFSTAETVSAGSANVNGNRVTSKKTALPLTPKSAGKMFATARDAVAELERGHGSRSALWTYHDVHGEPVGVVVRWDLPNGKKDIRPASRHGNAWRIGGMPEPRPLYCLPDLAGANRVYVCEGEKAADALRAIGLTATTSPHGCESPGKADWRPLAGKEIILLPDNDPPGGKYADAVAALLAKLTPAPVVKLVELPDLPEHGDAADFAETHAGTNVDDLRRIVEALASEAEPLNATWPAAPVERHEPFPVDALPEPLRGFVAAGARAIGCDPSYLALPMLTAIAAAIGNTRRIELKRGWTAPAIVWAAVVGESGTAKTPAFKLAMRPIRERQRKALDRHAEAMRQHEAHLSHYEKALVDWKQDKNSTDEPPEKPEAPQAERCIVSDTTVEALAPLLLANQRGLLLARDELAGWIGSFDRYAGGKGGADAAHWLSMHNGESIIVDRKTGNPRTIFVPQAAVSVCGGIQPAILHRALGIEHRESGLAARLLLTCPMRRAKRWTEVDIDPAAEAELARLIDRLYELQPSIGEEGEPRPVVVGLTPDANTAWIAFLQRPRPRTSRPGRRIVGGVVEARRVRGPAGACGSFRPLGGGRCDLGKRGRC